MPTGIKRGAIMLNNLIPFFDADDGATATTVNATNTGGFTGVTSEAIISAAPEATSKADEPDNTGTDVKAEAQKIADAMVAKKLKNMPSKEEMAEFKKWKEDQKTETEKIAEKLSEADRRMKAADAKEAKATAIMTAAKFGITADHIDDAVILATAKTSDDLTLEEAIKNIAAANPSWTTSAKLPSNGSNPAEEDDGRASETKRFF